MPAPFHPRARLAPTSDNRNKKEKHKGRPIISRVCKFAFTRFDPFSVWLFSSRSYFLRVSRLDNEKKSARYNVTPSERAKTNGAGMRGVNKSKVVSTHVLYEYTNTNLLTSCAARTPAISTLLLFAAPHKALHSNLNSEKDDF